MTVAVGRCYDARAFDSGGASSRLMEGNGGVHLHEISAMTVAVGRCYEARVFGTSGGASYAFWKAMVEYIYMRDFHHDRGSRSML
jgi:hypothetical protein